MRYLAISFLLLIGFSANATLPSAGYTTDEITGAAIVESGLQMQVFQAIVYKTVMYKLTALEKAGTLSAAEATFRNDIQNAGLGTSPALLRVIENIKQDTGGRWSTTGYWTNGSNMLVILDGAWPNILKKYQ